MLEQQTKQFLARVDAAHARAGNDPSVLGDLEATILHMPPQRAAQYLQLLLRSQDALRLFAPGVPRSFIWIAGARLDLANPDRWTESVATDFYREVRAAVGETACEATRSIAAARGEPQRRTRAVIAPLSSDAQERMWLSFSLCLDHDESRIEERAVEALLGDRQKMGPPTPAGPLGIFLPIGEQRDLATLQDVPIHGIDAEGAQRHHHTLAVAIQKWNALNNRHQVALGPGIFRLSQLVVESHAEAIANELLSFTRGTGGADALRDVEAALTIAVGRTPVTTPAPSCAISVGVYARDSASLVNFGLAKSLAGTDAETLLVAVKLYAQGLGIEADYVVLEPQKPVVRLEPGRLLMPCVDGVYRSPLHAHGGRAAWQIRDFGWEKGWAFEDWMSNNAMRALSPLPHPIAMERAGMMEALQQHYERPLLDKLRIEAEKPGRSRPMAQHELLKADPALEAVENAHEDSVYPLAGIYAAWHWKLAHGAMFVVRQTLIRRLEQTDIEKGFPMRYLRAPFPDGFFHFETPIRSRHAGGDDMSLTGFYVSEEKLEGQDIRLVSIGFAYRLGAEPIRFGAIELDFPVDDEQDADLVFELRERSKKLREIAPGASSDELQDIDAVNSAALIAAKVLLYASMKSARQVESLERTELLERIKGLKGNQREKVARKLASAYDAIVLGPEETEEDRMAEDMASRRMPVHWRRGHYREQPYGPGRQERKLIFISPVLVNASVAGAGAAPDPRPYVLE